MFFNAWFFDPCFLIREFIIFNFQSGDTFPIDDLSSTRVLVTVFRQLGPIPYAEIPSQTLLVSIPHFLHNFPELAHVH